MSNFSTLKSCEIKNTIDEKLPDVYAFCFKKAELASSLFNQCKLRKICFDSSCCAHTPYTFSSLLVRRSKSSFSVTWQISQWNGLLYASTTHYWNHSSHLTRLVSAPNVGNKHVFVSPYTQCVMHWHCFTILTDFYKWIFLTELNKLLSRIS